MIAVTACANTSIPSHNYHFYFVVRTFKISSLSNFQGYPIVLLSLLHYTLDTQKFFTSRNNLEPTSLHFPQSPFPRSHHSALFLWVYLFRFCVLSYSILLCLTYFTYIRSSRFTHVVANGTMSLLLMAKYYATVCVHLYPFVRGRHCAVSYCGYYEKRCTVRENAYFSLKYWLRVLWTYNQK